jgi:CheY-like chemotaxis protein
MKKILAIDDQSEVLNTIVEFLNGDDYEVYPAKTTTRAFSLMHQIKFDIVLLDVLMPGMSGIEFLDYAKKQIWYENTPVILFRRKPILRQFPRRLILARRAT